MSRGPKPRKNPGGLLRSLREVAGLAPGEAARAIGISRDAMSRREACPIGDVRIADVAAHAEAFAPGARIVIAGRVAIAVDGRGRPFGEPEPIDGRPAEVQRGDGAESS